MRWGILVNLAVILTVSGGLLFLVFTASLERSAVDAKVQQAIGLGNLVESAMLTSRTTEDIWRDLNRYCRSGAGNGAILYGENGAIIGECGARRELEAPNALDHGRRVRIIAGKWPTGVFRGITVISEVTAGSDRGVMSARIFSEIAPSVFAPAWKFFLAYLVLTQAALFMLGYILFHRTVIGPVREVARLASRAAGLAESDNYAQFATSKRDIQRISASLRGMIVKIIDDREKMEELIGQLQKTNRDLEAAQQGLIRSEKLASVGRLAAGIAHEIGNPLQIVMGYVELLLRRPEEDTQADILARMDGELDRIHGILRQLLDFARPIGKKIAPCDLNALIEDCASLVAGRRGFRHVELHYELDPALSQVETDLEKVRQILVNLIFNAADAIPESGGRITFRSRRMDSFAEIEIEDTGTGIAKEHLESVFDPFFTTKEPGKGTGLGLAVCLGLVESLGGTLSIRSREENGTVVVVTFPVVDGQSSVNAGDA